MNAETGEVKLPTITEALADIKVLNKRILKKQEFVNSHLLTGDHIKDPYADKGGVKKIVEEELQSIGDIRIRIVTLRAAINQANMNTGITINGETKSMYSWLTWRREIMETETVFVAKSAAKIQAELSQYNNRPQVWKDDDEKQHLVHLEPTVDPKLFQDASEKLDVIAGSLDGQLSMKNATTFVHI